jgi:Zn-dependent protease with chaperone function
LLAHELAHLKLGHLWKRALAAGKRLYRAVDVEAYAAQSAEPDDLWLWLAEHSATHPNLPKRLRTVMAQGALSLPEFADGAAVSVVSA